MCLSNVIDELLAQTTGDTKKELSSICSSVLGKETLRCCDYRKCAILILQALEKLKADKKIIELMRTLVEITEILYSNNSKWSSQSVLRLHNLTFKPCFHTIPNSYLRSMNAEVQERMFGQCKAITKATSSQRPDHIITNILLRLQEELKNNSSSLKVQEGEITKLANTLGSKHNTVFREQWLHQTPHQYQATIKGT